MDNPQVLKSETFRRAVFLSEDLIFIADEDGFV